MNYITLTATDDQIEEMAQQLRENNVFGCADLSETTLVKLLKEKLQNLLWDVMENPASYLGSQYRCPLEAAIGKALVEEEEREVQSAA